MVVQGHQGKEQHEGHGDFSVITFVDGPDRYHENKPNDYEIVEKLMGIFFREIAVGQGQLLKILSSIHSKNQQMFVPIVGCEVFIVVAPAPEIKRNGFYTGDQ